MHLGGKVNIKIIESGNIVQGTKFNESFDEIMFL